MKVLIIEDDQQKCQLILNVVQNLDMISEVMEVHSYKAAVKTILSHEFDIIVLDMSLPTFDEDGFIKNTSFEKFGGLKIMSEMKRKSKTIPTILVTMFDNFPNGDNIISLRDLSKELENRFLFYKGTVFFDFSSEEWINKLKLMLNDIHSNR